MTTTPTSVANDRQESRGYRTHSIPVDTIDGLYVVEVHTIITSFHLLPSLTNNNSNSSKKENWVLPKLNLVEITQRLWYCELKRNRSGEANTAVFRFPALRTRSVAHDATATDLRLHTSVVYILHSDGSVLMLTTKFPEDAVTLARYFGEYVRSAVDDEMLKSMTPISKIDVRIAQCSGTVYRSLANGSSRRKRLIHIRGLELAVHRWQEEEEEEVQQKPIPHGGVSVFNALSQHTTKRSRIPPATAEDGDDDVDDWLDNVSPWLMSHASERVHQMVHSSSHSDLNDNTQDKCATEAGKDTDALLSFCYASRRWHVESVPTRRALTEARLRIDSADAEDSRTPNRRLTDGVEVVVSHTGTIRVLRCTSVEALLCVVRDVLAPLIASSSN